MKKLVLGLLSLVLVFGTLSAQEGKKALKTASKAYGAYNLSPMNNADKLQEAITAIETATTAEDTKNTAKAWLVKGDIYNSICRNFATLSQLNPAHKKEVSNAAILAHDAYMQAMEYAEKKYEKKDGMKGIAENQNYLVGEGATAYENKDYEAAYTAFRAALTAHDYLVEKEEKSIFEEESARQDQMYYTALAALNAQKMEEAKPVFMALKDAGYEKPAVYEALYKLELTTDRAAALTILSAGREKFPEDISLLFSEINHYLQDGKLDVLTGKLNKAIEKEPENASLYSTLGNVYDNLYQKELEAGNQEKAQEYFEAAFKNYNTALKKQPDFFDATYSIGALYYNRAAATTKEMNKLQDDYSKEGLKKYDALRKLVLEQFDEALPYFKTAEKLNPNDRNTLIALKEIFARKDDLATSNEFKSRLETVENGGKNESSYFNE